MNIEERKQRWLDFYAGVRRTVVLVGVEHPEVGPRPLPWPENMDAFFDWIIRDYHAQLETASWLDDDALPYVSALMGTDIFPAAFGAPVHYIEGNMPCARPFIFSSREAARVRLPRLEDTSLMRVFEFGQRLRAAAPEALIQLPDIQSPLDIAALMWDKADLFMTMCDEPEAVKDFIALAERLLTDFLDLWFATFGREFISHFPSYYMPWGVTLSEDEIGSISPAACREFSFPSLCRLSERYGGRIGIHCCAASRHQWGILKEIPGFTLFNIFQSDEILREASVFFREGPPLWAEGTQNECFDFGSRPVLQGWASRERAQAELTRLREYARNFR